MIPELVRWSEVVLTADEVSIGLGGCSGCSLPVMITVVKSHRREYRMSMASVSATVVEMSNMFGASAMAKSHAGRNLHSACAAMVASMAA